MFNPQSVINPALWPNGPAPGCFFNFPGNVPVSNGLQKTTNGFTTRTQSPVTTGTSVLGLIFEGGVMLAADTLGSYGSLAKFRDIERVIKVNDSTILGATGDIADFQHLKSIIDQKVIDEECADDGFTLKPKALHTWLTRVLYNRRSKFDPLWNTFLVAGMEDGKPYLGCVDKIGTAFTDDKIATGYGAHLALPLMRAAKSDLSQQEARTLMMDCLRVLFYRDCRALNRVQIATITSEGVSIEGPMALEVNWSAASMIQGYE